jgi:hypothetical protein
LGGGQAAQEAPAEMVAEMKEAAARAEMVAEMKEVAARAVPFL